jgi:hypothetical protein
MAPRYAASALQKLLRWAGTHAGYVGLNMANTDSRLAYCRQSELGQALAAKAQGLDSADVLDRLDEELDGVTPLEMATAFAEIVHSCFPDADLDVILNCASKLSLAVANRWTVTHAKQ